MQTQPTCRMVGRYPYDGQQYLSNPKLPWEIMLPRNFWRLAPIPTSSTPFPTQWSIFLVRNNQFGSHPHEWNQRVIMIPSFLYFIFSPLSHTRKYILFLLHVYRVHPNVRGGHMQGKQHIPPPHTHHG